MIRQPEQLENSERLSDIANYLARLAQLLYQIEKLLEDADVKYYGGVDENGMLMEEDTVGSLAATEEAHRINKEVAALQQMIASLALRKLQKGEYTMSPGEAAYALPADGNKPYVDDPWLYAPKKPTKL